MNDFGSAEYYEVYLKEYQTLVAVLQGLAAYFEFHRGTLHQALGYKLAESLSQWSLNRRKDSEAHVAYAAEAVKGLRSQSLAPMNSAN